MSSSPQDPRDTADLTPLAWVQEEIRRTLEGVHKSLRRTLREFELRSASGQINPDMAVTGLGPAATQLHQVAGVLRMVNQREAALVARSNEGLVRRMIERVVVSLEDVEAIERADFALLTFMARQLSGSPVSPLGLFPAYRKVQELAQAERIQPADFWPAQFAWQTLPPPQVEQPVPELLALRTAFETALLRQMRQANATHAGQLAELSLGLAAALKDEPQASFWQLSAAHFEAQALGMIAPDHFVKRLGSRLLAQLRNHMQGQPELSDRLVQDLLFFCAQSGEPPEGRAPHLHNVRAAYGLDGKLGGDYGDDSLGRIDPALIAQALRRVQLAKEGWGALAEGETGRAAGLDEAFGGVAESLQQMIPGGEVLGQTLQRAAVLTLRSGQRPGANLGMEMATALLYLEAAFEDGVFDQPEQAGRLARLAQRVQAAAAGQGGEPLEVWMEELFRRVADRQTLGSVVHELRHSLTEVERQCDDYFRDPTQRQQLIPVPGQLAAMRGVFSVLGMDQAALTCLRMRDEVDRLAETEVDVSLPGPRAIFDRLANNLGQLGFLIDMLSVQAPLAKSMFLFNEGSGELEALVERELRTMPPLAAPAPRSVEPAPAPLVQQAVERLTPATVEIPPMPSVDFAPTKAPEPTPAPALDIAALDLPSLDLEPVAEPAPVAVAAPVIEAIVPAPVEAPKPAPAPVVEEVDAEMLEIFLEEASEVLETARQSLTALADEPGARDQVTTVRRAFHTLKGSSRMVGLNEFGEAGWACEQLYNTVLSDEKPIDDVLLGFSADALDELAAWRDEIAANQGSSARSAQGLRARADALRLGTPMPAAAPVAPAPSFQATLPGASEPVEFASTVPPEQREPMPALEFGDTAPMEYPVEEHVSMPVEPVETFEPITLDLSQPEVVEAVTPEALPEVAETVEPAAMSELDLPEPATEPALESEPAPVSPLEVSLDELPAPIDAAPEVEEAFELDLSLPVPAPAPLPAQTLPELELQLDLSEPQLLDLGAAVEVVEMPAPLEEPAVEEPAPLLDLGTPETPPESVEEALPLPEAVEVVEAPAELLDLGETLDLSMPAEAEPVAAAIEPEPAPVVETAVAEPVLEEAPAGEELRQIGPLSISQTLYNIFMSEADHQSSRLAVELAEWAAQPDEAPPPNTEVYSHALAGNAATVGFEALSVLARALEHALGRAQQARRVAPDDAALFARAADEIAHLLHQFAAGFLREPEASLVPALQAYQPELPPETVDTGMGGLDEPAPAPVEPAALVALDDDAEFLSGEPDQIDEELWEIFEEEATELLHQLHARLRDWTSHAQDNARGDACMRTLHTFKGGARLAGAMHIGELAHRLESAVAALMARNERSAADVLPLQHRGDEIEAEFERKRQSLRAPAAKPAAPAPAPVVAAPEAAPVVEAARPVVPEHVPLHKAEPEIVLAPDAVDWSRFAGQDAREISTADAAPLVSGQALVRVRASLLDRLASQAGEVSIRRARMENELTQMKTALLELDDNLERLRTQLRELEVQAEAQISSRQEQAKATGSDFDPLEFDRFTRFQEVTRMLAESVNDVATVQRSLQRNVAQGEDELAAQSRLTRELQDDLLRSRMVEFDSLAERLHRVVRQAAREGNKQVQLDLQGGGIELDRGVLERLIGAFEHLLRNSVAHGIEQPAEREKSGKPAMGTIRIKLSQEGNQVLIAFSDDGAGLNLARIREKAARLGLLPEGREPAEQELVQMIYHPGFSTASAVTELAGRGVGMDVVRAEVNTLGGYVLTRTQQGKGAEFDLRVPLTTALTQVVLLRCGELEVAVPASLVDTVLRLPNAQLEQAYASGQLKLSKAGQDLEVPMYWMGGLLAHDDHPQLHGKHAAVVLVHSGPDRIAIHVDEVVGNQEVVVKNLGPQLIHVPGLAGISLLASGAVALIYNPVALAERYGAQANARAHAGGAPVIAVVEPTAPQAPLIMVVDDSLTVRRVSQRFLEREGYRVQLAKDGLDAIEQLAREDLPDLVLSDIEMPRMDGFDLVRNIRAQDRLRHLPIVMITSRIAAKHREYAEQLGVQGYLGKPYDEDVLKGLIRQYTGSKEAATAA